MWDPDYNKKEAQEPLLHKVYYEKAPSNSYQPPKSLSSSPAPVRRFNDVIFALAFLATIAAFVAVSVTGFVRGNPSHLQPSSQFMPIINEERPSWFQDQVAMAKEDRWILLSCVGLAVVLGFFWVQLVKSFTKIFIYGTLFVGIGMVLSTAVYFLTQGIQRQNNGLKIVSYVVFGIAALLFICLILLRKKIALTQALFKESCEGIKQSPTLIPVSLITVGIFTLFSVFWVASFFYLFSVPEKQLSGEVHPLLRFNTSIRNAMYFQVFAYFWISSFISAVFQTTVAGSLSHWYFSRDSRASNHGFGAAPIQSFGRALTTSFGSLALGSLILALFQFANFALNLAKKSNPNNRILRAILSVFQCILGCFEGFFRFVNRFAYIYIGIKGDSFCNSAKNCHSLVSRNYFSVAVVDILGSLVLFVGKLCGAALTTTVCMIVLQYLHRSVSGVTIALVAGTSYWIFNLYSQMIHVGVDTVFISYLFDLEMSKNSGNLLISNEIHHLLQQKSSKPHI